MKFRDVRIILLKEWDPLCVGDNPHLADEYDSFIPDLIREIQHGADIAAISESLRKIEIKLEVNPPSGQRVRAAKRLVKMRA